MEWHYCWDRLRRALLLAATVDRNGPTFTTVGDFLLGLVPRLKGQDFRLLALRLCKALHEHNLDEPSNFAQALEDQAKLNHTEGEQRHELNSQCLILAAHLYDKCHDTIAKDRCKVAAAEALEEHAKTFLKNRGGRLSAPYFMAQAVQLMRGVGGFEARATKMHKTMLQWQREGMEDLIAISSPVEISSEILDGVRSVVGLDFPESMVRLATFIGPTSMSVLRQSAEREVSSPLARIMPNSWLRTDGKLDEVAGDLTMQGPLPSEYLNKVMHNAARHCWQFHGHLVHLAMGQVKEAFKDIDWGLDWLVHSSRFVPHDRRVAFQRGLEAGFNLDLFAAMHILVPQLENSLRYVLELSGEVASRLDSDGVQDEFQLTRLLNHPKLRELLGEDTVFDLKGLLNERAGANIRNVLSHGIESDSRWSQIDCLYLWWLTLRLCVIHMEFPKLADSESAE